MWTSIFLTLAGLSSLVALTALVMFEVSLRRWAWLRPPPAEPRPAGARPLETRPPRRLSVVVPARNEEKDLESCVRSILAQEGVALEVIVVNDHSRDRTGEIADELARLDSRVRVVHDPPLPPGWLGKVNAMQAGVACAREELLVFSDADIIHHPHGFLSGLAELERRQLDLVSLLPRIVFRGLWENSLIPALVAFFALPFREPLAAGAFILVSRRVLEEAGGLAAIRDKALDDVELARLVHRRGQRTAFYLAPDLLSVRLFKGSRDAFFGATKNILSVLQGWVWVTIPILPAQFVIFWAPLAAVLAGAWTGQILLVAAGAFAYAAHAAYVFRSRAFVEIHPLRALFFPLVVFPTSACVVRALYFRLRRGAVYWRGRLVRVPP